MSGDIKAIARYAVHVGDGKYYVQEYGQEAVNLPGERKDYEVNIHNARPINDTLSIHKQGFVLRQHTSKVSDFYNDEEVKNVYYPEIEKFLYNEIPEAKRVFIFDHTQRSNSKEILEEKKIRPTANGLHGDYTWNSGPKRVRDLFPEEAEELLKNRFLIINVWRPMDTVERLPLAFVDAQTVGNEDYLVIQRILPDRVGEIMQVKYSDKHEWYYFPKMERNEVAVFKTFDSQEDGVTRFTPHTAVNVVDQQPDAPARESIEIRALIFL